MIQKHIAAIELVIECDTAYEIFDQNPVSKDFFNTKNIPDSDHQVHIRLCAGDAPCINKTNLQFQADHSWSIYKNTHFIDIVFHPPAFKNSLWIARFDNNFEKGVIYCSEQKITRQAGRPVISNPVVYPLDQILLMHILSRIGGMIIHAAGWEYNNSGWIFAGKSGAGKSTITNLITKRGYGQILSDDRMIVRKHSNDFLMYGTPWPGDAGYALNQSAPLKGVFFLSQGTENHINELKPSDAVSGLMPVVSIPWYDRDKVEQMMTFCDSLMGNIPMYQLTFKPDEPVVDMLMEFVNE